MSRKEMAELTKRLKAIFERDESGAWIVRIPEIRGCHSYGRSLDEARRRIREALGLWIDHAEDVELDEEIRLPAAARTALRRAKLARARADREHDVAQRETQRSARALLEDMGIGMRDAGELLGISHQRVQQLVKR
jgi:predicted RNase H-like HicB family nuclease